MAPRGRRRGSGRPGGAVPAGSGVRRDAWSWDALRPGSRSRREQRGGLADPLDGGQRDHDCSRVGVPDRGGQDGVVAAAGETASARGRPSEGPLARGAAVMDAQADLVAFGVTADVLPHWGGGIRLAIPRSRGRRTGRTPPPPNPTRHLRPRSSGRGPGRAGPARARGPRALVIMRVAVLECLLGQGPAVRGAPGRRGPASAAVRGCRARRG